MKRNSLKRFMLVFLILLPMSSIKVFAKEKEDFTICIDPGHQRNGESQGEQVSPEGGGMKPRVSSGTAGIKTKNPEFEINLQASEILKEILEEDGYKVVMTREGHDVKISNKERADISNNVNADITIRIHCDGSNDTSKTGGSILIPDKESKVTLPIYDESKAFAEILKETLKKNQIKINGIFERQDITGFNWSKVPVVIFEMGFMSNYNEDEMLANKEYQKKLMDSVKEAVDQYAT